MKGEVERKFKIYILRAELSARVYLQQWGEDEKNNKGIILFWCTSTLVDGTTKNKFPVLGSRTSSWP